MNLAPFLDELAAKIAGQVAELLAESSPDSGQVSEESWRLLNLEEAAARLGRSARWVRDHKDAIGWVRLDGGALGFELEDLRRFARERRIAGTPLAVVEDPLHSDRFSAGNLPARQKARVGGGA